MTAIDRLAAWCENPTTFEYPRVEDVQAVTTIAGAGADLIAAIDAFKAFENENPNDSTKRWDAVFEAKCEAEDALRRALAEAVEP